MGSLFSPLISKLWIGGEEQYFIYILDGKEVSYKANCNENQT